jgi:hypothetical protein
MSEHLFAVVVVIVINNDNNISVFNNAVSSGLNKILGWQFYLMSASNLFVSHAPSCSTHIASES